MASRHVDTFLTPYFPRWSPETAGPVSDIDLYHSIGQIKHQTEPGEILEFQRGSYIQYALYLGDGRVMNIHAEDHRVDEAQIREGNLEDVLNDVRVRVRNHEQLAYEHFQLYAKPSYDIVRAAMSYANQVVPYEFDFRNSEYYCTLWRYGKGFSTQAAQILLDR